MIFSHAFGEVAWGSLNKLAQSFTVIVPAWDSAEFGSGRLASFDWLDPLLEELGQSQAGLCVWSMACPPAIEFIVTAQPPLTHLILVDMAGLSEDFIRLRFSALPHFLLTRLLGRPTRGLVRAMWKQWIHSETLDRRLLEEAMFRFLCDNPLDAFDDDEDEISGEALDTIDDDDDESDDESEALLDRLAEISIPTLILTGRHSPVLGPDLATNAQKRMTSALVSIFEHSSHTLQLEEPDRFQQVVSEFVSGSS